MGHLEHGNRSSRLWIKRVREYNMFEIISSTKVKLVIVKKLGWTFSPTRIPWKS